MNAYSLMESDDTWVPFEVGRVKWLRQDDDVQAGIWACEPREIPERNPTNFDRDETIVILGGRLTVEIEDGPTVEIVAVEDIPKHLPHFDTNAITTDEWAERIAQRQAAIDNRMLG